MWQPTCRPIRPWAKLADARQSPILWTQPASRWFAGWFAGCAFSASNRDGDGLAKDLARENAMTDQLAPDVGKTGGGDRRVVPLSRGLSTKLLLLTILFVLLA